jgi:4-nitrophenyl phosphatase
MNGRIGLIIDLDGTMYRGRKMVENADLFVRRLKERSIPHLFLTNNSSRPPEQVAAHLRGLGIVAEDSSVYTAAQAAAGYVRRQREGAKVFVVGEEGLRQAIRQEGLKIVEDGPADYVVQGIDRNFHYDVLKAAVRLIRGGAVYVQTNPDLLLPSDGELLPGAGSIGAAIQAASGASPVVIGKPSTIIMEDAIRLLGLPRDRIWVIGDNAATDVKAGRAAGCRTALVLTGLTTRDNMDVLLRQAGEQPDLICDDLLSLWDAVIGDSYAV